MNARLLLALISVAAAMWGCGDENPAESAPGEIRMYLLDAIAGYEAVNIVVTEVSVHSADADSTSGWSVVNDTTRTFDLLTLVNGASSILGDSPLAPGHYTQIRLKLGTGSSVVVDGQTYPLTVPSGLQTGLKLNHEFDIQPSTVYELTLDFDAERSIHRNGGGEYVLSPVIRVIANEISGTISGTISPASAQALVSTVVNNNAVATFADTTSGAFKLMALPAGTYAVHVEPQAGGYQDTTLTDVPVIATQDTDVGIITLHP